VGHLWLTGEMAIVKLTRDIVRTNNARYIMRPDFLLNVITLAPSASAARRAFRAVFPTMLGIRLARRMQPTTFDQMMDKVAEAETLDDARRIVEMSKLTNELKSDFGRQCLAAGPDAQIASIDAVAAQRADEMVAAGL
jgi:hypothetical protein